MFRNLICRRGGFNSTTRITQQCWMTGTSIRSMSQNHVLLQQSTPHHKENPNATVDVELPDPMKEKRKVRNSTVVFAITMIASFIGIVKYEDANAPVVSSTLYTLRRSSKGREILGNNISFNSLMPWVSGKLQSGRGVVDFSYTAIGEKNSAVVHFEARKDAVTKRFKVLDWSITTPDGIKISLMDEDFHPFVPGSKEEPTSRPAVYSQ